VLYEVKNGRLSSVTATTLVAHRGKSNLPLGAVNDPRRSIANAAVAMLGTVERSATITMKLHILGCGDAFGSGGRNQSG
jgi:hypothetical protein